MVSSNVQMIESCVLSNRYSCDELALILQISKQYTMIHSWLLVYRTKKVTCWNFELSMGLKLRVLKTIFVRFNNFVNFCYLTVGQYEIIYQIHTFLYYYNDVIVILHADFPKLCSFYVLIKFYKIHDINIIIISKRVIYGID